jgi:hypothetical protein
MGDWGKRWEIQVQPVAVQSKPKKGCKMQEGDAGTKSLYIPPIRPLSGKTIVFLELNKAVAEVSFLTTSYIMDIVKMDEIGFMSISDEHNAQVFLRFDFSIFKPQKGFKSRYNGMFVQSKMNVIVQRRVGVKGTGFWMRI